MDFGKHHWIYIYMLVHVMILIEGRDNEERPGMRTEDLKAYIIELEPERKQVEINKPFGNEGIINSDSGEVDGEEQIPVTWLAAMRQYVTKMVSISNWIPKNNVFSQVTKEVNVWNYNPRLIVINIAMDQEDNSDAHEMNVTGTHDEVVLENNDQEHVSEVDNELTTENNNQMGVSEVNIEDNTKLPVANGQWIGRPNDHLNDTASLTEPKSKGSMHEDDLRKTSIEESEKVDSSNAKAEQEGNDGTRRKRSLFDVGKDTYGTGSETLFGRSSRGNGGGPTNGNVDERTRQ